MMKLLKLAVLVGIVAFATAQSGSGDDSGFTAPARFTTAAGGTGMGNSGGGNGGEGGEGGYTGETGNSGMGGASKGGKTMGGMGGHSKGGMGMGGGSKGGMGGGSKGGSGKSGETGSSAEGGEGGAAPYGEGGEAGYLQMQQNMQTQHAAFAGIGAVALVAGVGFVAVRRYRKTTEYTSVVVRAGTSGAYDEMTPLIV